MGLKEIVTGSLVPEEAVDRGLGKTEESCGGVGGTAELALDAGKLSMRVSVENDIGVIKWPP